MGKNKLAGKHPSYDKRNMSEEQIRKKRERDAKLQKKPAQVKKRVEANAFNRKNGKKSDGLDASHQKDGSIKLEKASKNRGKVGEGGRKKGKK